MRRYLAYTRQGFLSHSAFRFDNVMGIMDTCLKVLIFWCIYRALYGGAESVDGITLAMVSTNFVLSIGLNAAFSMDENYLPGRIRNGSIGNELLKPISFRGIALASDLGKSSFQLLFRFLPAILLVMGTVGMIPPTSVKGFVLFLGSAVLGFLVLWMLNFIVQTFAFWILNVWSVRTIKNVVVNVLSGSMLPLWFLPSWMETVIECTPFSSIYFIPVQLYLGEISGAAAGISLCRQVVWIVALYLIGEILWRLGIRKLVVQGG